MIKKLLVFWLWVHARLGCRFLSRGHQLRDSKLKMEDLVNGHFIHYPLWFGLAYWVLFTLLLVYWTSYLI
jgi:hypothetical protein